MNPIGLPATLESLANQCTETSRYFRVLGQALVRSDLDSNGPKRTALAACYRLRRELEALEERLNPSSSPPEAKLLKQVPGLRISKPIAITEATPAPLPSPAKDPTNGKSSVVRKWNDPRATK